MAVVILAHARRRVVHVAVTEHPTAAWTAQQLREAFPWDQAPRYLLRDRDQAFTAKAIGIEEVLTAPHSPWRNALLKRARVGQRLVERRLERVSALK
jgi:hypothetical protein